MVSAFYFIGDKQKFGRSPGTGLIEEAGVTWDQANAFTDGGLPGGLWKAEINHTFSPNFYMSAKAAYYDTGFGLTAQGDATKNYTYDYEAGIAKGTYLHTTWPSVRRKPPTSTATTSRPGMGGNHELKFGFGYRNNTTNSVTHYNGNGLSGEYYGPGTGGGDNIAYIYRDYVVNYGGKYISGYAGDVFTKNRLTINAGFRVDKQTAQNLASEGPANVSFPSILPAATYAGGDNVFDFLDVSPRLGMSYALE